MSPRLEVLAGLVKSHYPAKDPAHDWPHILRVVRTCQDLAQGETIEIECLLAAAYCHDLVNLPKSHPQRAEASRMSGETAAPLLEQAGFHLKEIDFIKGIILDHSYSAGRKATSLESAILQDADRMDALGAIGILRCASVNTQMQTSFYDAQDPFAIARELNDKAFMLDHYEVKLFKLPSLMNTPRGQQEALKRAQFMQQFLEQFKKEI